MVAYPFPRSSGGHRARQQESLCQVAAHIVERGESALVFDSFGNHFQLAFVGQTDHRANDLLVSPGMQHAADETLVNLEGIDRQSGEIGEAGVAGAEIVDGDGDTHRA